MYSHGLDSSQRTMKKLETLMKRHANNFGEKESMIVMYACKHWSKKKHKMFVQRKIYGQEVIKYIRDIALLNSFFFLTQRQKNEKQSKIKGY